MNNLQKFTLLIQQVPRAPISCIRLYDDKKVSIGWRSVNLDDDG